MKTRIQIYFEEVSSYDIGVQLGGPPERINIDKNFFAYRKNLELELELLPQKGEEIWVRIHGQDYKTKVYSSGEENEFDLPVVKAQFINMNDLPVAKKAGPLIAWLESDGWMLWKKREFTEKERENQLLDHLGYNERGIPSK